MAGTNGDSASPSRADGAARRAPAQQHAAAPQAGAAAAPKRKRMTPMGHALMALSLATAVVAVFWPQLAPHLTELARAAAPKVARAGGEGGAGKACPLGYTSASGTPLPAGHPPINGAAAPAAAAAASPAAAAPRGAAPRRLIWIRAAEIWTADERAPRARAMAVDAGSGEVVRVGGEPEAGSSYDVIDFGDAFVMPGIVDSHVHFIPGGLSLSSVDLRRASSKEEFVAAVAAAAEKLGPDDWLTGGFWDDNLWGGATPDASWIDAACGGRPALLTRMDSHMALANTEALRRAGVGPGTAEPEDGRIDRDPESGEPTGIFRETAMRLVSSVIPPPPAERRRAAALAAADYALSRGITSVVDFGRSPFADQGASWRDLEEVYDSLADDGQLPVRVYAFAPLDHWGAIATRVAARGYAHPGGRLFWGGAKAFADGSLGSRTALMLNPYDDAPAQTGVRMTPLADLRRDARAADAAGLQIAIHAIGDRAVDEVVEIFEDLVRSRGAGDSAGVTTGGRAAAEARRAPLRVEHAQHISGAGAAARLGALGGGAAAAVANPQHLVTDGPMLLRRLGAERAATDRSFAWPALHGAGAAVAAGSDWPVVDAAPFEGVAAAAARTLEHAGLAGAPGAAAGDEATEAVRAAVEDALRMHTAASADAAWFMGRAAGRLSPGRKADFVVLSRSPMAAAAEAGVRLGGGLEGVRVVSTYVDGRCAYGCAGGGGGGGAAAAAA